jgi:hypothetical protein
MCTLCPKCCTNLSFEGLCVWWLSSFAPPAMTACTCGRRRACPNPVQLRRAGGCSSTATAPRSTWSSTGQPRWQAPWRPARCGTRSPRRRAAASQGRPSRVTPAAAGRRQSARPRPNCRRRMSERGAARGAALAVRPATAVRLWGQGLVGCDVVTGVCNKRLRALCGRPCAAGPDLTVARDFSAEAACPNKADTKQARGRRRASRRRAGCGQT